MAPVVLVGAGGGVFVARAGGAVFVAGAVAVPVAVGGVVDVAVEVRVGVEVLHRLPRLPRLRFSFWKINVEGPLTPPMVQILPPMPAGV